jgi:hypothetical protein
MANYVITGKNGSGESVVAVQISAISQEGTVVPELDVVNAVRAFIGTVPGIGSVVAQKFEQVITNV